jgi:hypothetical protein
MSTMRGSEHPELLGAYVMGLVDDAERAEIEAHLAVCGVCQAEIAELAGLRDVLDAVPRQAVLDDLAALDAADRPGAPPPGDDLLLRRTLKEVRAESGRGRRRQWLGVAAGVVAIAALSGVGGLALGRTGDEGTGPPVAVEQPGQRQVTASDDGTGVGITAKIIPAGTTWTRLNVSVTGVEPGTVCQIVVTGKDGQRDVAGSWIVGTPQPGAPRRGVDGSTMIAPSDLETIQIVDGSGKRLVTVEA